MSAGTVRALLALLLVPLLAASVLVVTAPRSVAVPLLPDPGGATTARPVFLDAVYGDFLHIGNSVLRCPQPGEPTGPGGPAETCAQAVAGGGASGPLADSQRNNGYQLRRSDVDNDPETFDSSTAEVTVPAGASVVYARLSWGGHTGRYFASSLANCADPVLGPAEPPPSPAAAAPKDQPLRLRVDGAGPSTVRAPEANYQESDGLLDYAQLYTSWAEVTGAFAGVRTGAAIPVTVGNVWAQSGVGCAAGWSLTLVYAFPGASPEQPQPRQVQVLDLHGRLGPLNPLTVPVLGAGRVPGGQVRTAVTAFDGDAGLGTERLSIDGTEVTEPCRGSGTEDVLDSCAQGARSLSGSGPAPVNTLGVDAKTVLTPVTGTEGQAGSMEFSATTDVAVVSEVVRSDPINPAVRVEVASPAGPVRQGDVIDVAVRVSNPGSMPLSGVTLTATDGAASPQDHCDPVPGGALAPGAAVELTCTRLAGADAVRTELRADATYLTTVPEGTARTVTATGSASTPVIRAATTVTRVADRTIVRAGTDVGFAVTVSNNSTDNTLRDLVYSDSSTADCPNKTLENLPPATSTRLRCTATAVAQSFTSSGELNGTDDTGTAFPAVFSQETTVTVINPSATVSASADRDTVYRGDPVTLTFTVTNTGNGPAEALDNVTVTVPELPDCHPAAVPVLQAGESATLSCPVNPQQSVSATPKAEATDRSGTALTTTGTAVPITVLEPLIALERTLDPDTVRAGGSATLRYTLRHVGSTEDGPVTEVTLTDPETGCTLEGEPRLDPGASVTRTCEVTPRSSVTSAPQAGAKDAQGRQMTVRVDPAPLTVINPALMLGVTGEPAEVAPGQPTQFTVAVRNTGDVPLRVAVDNDSVPDCDLDIGGDGLPPGASQSRQCTVTMAAAGELTDVATYAATVTGEVDDPGAPLTGRASATVRSSGAPVSPASAQAGGTAGGAGGTSAGTSGISTSDSSTSTAQTATPGAETAGRMAGAATDSGGSEAARKLAYTGVPVTELAVLGGGTVLGGTALVLTGRRSRRGR